MGLLILGYGQSVGQVVEYTTQDRSARNSIPSARSVLEQEILLHIEPVNSAGRNELYLYFKESVSTYSMSRAISPRTTLQVRMFAEC